MAKLPRVSGREAARAFEKVGFTFDHQTGSHIIYYHPDGARRRGASQRNSKDRKGAKTR